mmetsp:Transcript_12535/g.19397  ORF Transcript_12535/g.19397 Transcript_12535/m.19397 type:complete len:292 (-) Transcript_12535:249-1124(-)
MGSIEAIVQKVVMQFLEPPRGEKIETKNLTDAHDQLIHACDSCNDSEFRPHDSSWLIARCDFYRCLIVVSLLLAVNNGVSKTEALEKIVEQSLILLQILVGAESELDLPDRTPPSQYSILNDLLIEPLVPLSHEERQQLWISNSQGRINEEEIENVTLPLPNKMELIKEERQLIKMANRPIPSNYKEKIPLLEENIENQLFLPGDILCKDERLLLLRCGALLDQNGDVSWLTEKSSIVTSRKGDSKKVMLAISKEQQFEVEEGCKWIQSFDIAQKQVQARNELRKQAEELW